MQCSASVRFRRRMRNQSRSLSVHCEFIGRLSACHQDSGRSDETTLIFWAIFTGKPSSRPGLQRVGRGPPMQVYQVLKRAPSFATRQKRTLVALTRFICCLRYENVQMIRSRSSVPTFRAFRSGLILQSPMNSAIVILQVTTASSLGPAPKRRLVGWSTTL